MVSSVLIEQGDVPDRLSDHSCFLQHLFCHIGAGRIVIIEPSARQSPLTDWLLYQQDLPVLDHRRPGIQLRRPVARPAQKVVFTRLRWRYPISKTISDGISCNRWKRSIL